MEIAHRFIGGTIIPAVVFIPNLTGRTKIIKICRHCGKKTEQERKKLDMFYWFWLNSATFFENYYHKC